MGPIVAEIFEGPHYGSIFGTLMVALIGGGAAGPWVTGVIHDATGSYRLAFVLAIACCVVSAIGDLDRRAAQGAAGAPAACSNSQAGTVGVRFTWSGGCSGRAGFAALLRRTGWPL